MSKNPKVSQEEGLTTVSLDFVIRLTPGTGLLSLVLLVVARAMWRFDNVRAGCAGVGGVLAPIAVAVGIWSAIRLRSFVCFLVTIPAIIALSGWIHVMRVLTYGQ